MPGLRGRWRTEGRSMGWLAAWCGAGIVLLACAGDRIVVGGQLPPLVSELVDDDAGARSDAGVSPSGVGIRAECPDSPNERRGLLACWPTRQIGRWQGFWLGLPRYETVDGTSAEFPPGDVVLRFGIDGTGTLSVGDGLSAAPAACGPGRDAGVCAPVGELLGGFAYRLENIRLQDAGERGTPRVAGEPLPRAGELMQFDLRLGEPWDAACASEAAMSCPGGVCPAAKTKDTAGAHAGAEPALPCRCGADQCVAEAPTLSVALAMSEDGQALRGVYRPRDVRLAPVGLELIRVAGP